MLVRSRFKYCRKYDAQLQSFHTKLLQSPTPDFSR